jgi:hypothetical protein
MTIQVEASFAFPTVSAGMARGLLRKGNYEIMKVIGMDTEIYIMYMYACSHIWKLNLP